MDKSRISYNYLFEELIRLGLWDSEHDLKYGFNLATKPFNLSKYKSQFQQIGLEVVNFYGELNELIFNPKEHLSKEDATIYRILRKAKNGYPFFQSDKLPPVIKVDIIINSNNELKIVEIDGYNPRGIPYAIILNEIYNSNNNLLENCIKTELALRKQKKLVWVHPSRERYYLKSMLFFKEHMKRKFDVDVILINANEDKLYEGDCSYLLAPWGLSKPAEILLKKKLLEIYKYDQSKFLFPIKPWLNNKSLLAFPFLKNYKSLFSFSKSTSGLINFLPYTTFRKGEINDFSKFILKRGISSGHKGVYFPTTEEHKNFINKISTKKNEEFIFQEVVDQKKINIEYYKDREITTRPFYCRFIAHYNSLGELLSIDLTGRSEAMVFGSNDSVQTSCYYDY